MHVWTVYALLMLDCWKLPIHSFIHSFIHYTRDFPEGQVRTVLVSSLSIGNCLLGTACWDLPNGNYTLPACGCTHCSKHEQVACRKHKLTHRCVCQLPCLTACGNA